MGSGTSVKMSASREIDWRTEHIYSIRLAPFPFFLIMKRSRRVHEVLNGRVALIRDDI
jgi:hypothetical protein